MNVKPLITAFQLCGIDFLDNMPSLNKNLCPISIAFCMKICAYITCILKIIQTVYSICLATADSNTIFLSNRLVEILNVSLLLSLIYKRKSIWKLLLHISNVHRKINPNTTILKKTHISLVIAISFGNFVMNYTFVYLNSTDNIKSYIKKAFSNLLSENMPTYSLCFLAIIDFLTFLILESSSMYFDLLYSVICRILRGLIKEYIRKFNFDAFETLCDNHTVIFEAISYADRSLSFPLFINLFFHVDMLYFLCVWFMKNYDGNSVMLKVSRLRIFYQPKDAFE